MSLFNEKIDAFLRQGSNLNHVLVHADSLQKRTISKSCVDLTVTSPPYNVGKAYDGSQESDSIEYGEYLRFTEKWLANCYHWTKSTGRLCVNVSLDKNRNGKQPLSADVTKIAMDVGWKYHATIVWNEGNISRRTAWGSWMSASAITLSHQLKQSSSYIKTNGSGFDQGIVIYFEMSSKSGSLVFGVSMVRTERESGMKHLFRGNFQSVV